MSLLEHSKMERNLQAPTFKRVVSDGSESTDLEPTKGDRPRGISDGSTAASESSGLQCELEIASIKEQAAGAQRVADQASGAHPTATFANDHLLCSGHLKWCPPLQAKKERVEEAAKHVVRQENLTSGAYPTATFPNCHLIAPSLPKWCVAVPAQ